MQYVRFGNMDLQVSVDARTAGVSGVERNRRSGDLPTFTESALMVTPRELLDTSIAQLRTLVAFLGDQLAECGGASTVQSASREFCACKELLISLGVLIPRLCSYHLLSAPLAPLCQSLLEKTNDF